MNEAFQVPVFDSDIFLFSWSRKNTKFRASHTAEHVKQATEEMLNAREIDKE